MTDPTTTTTNDPAEPGSSGLVSLQRVAEQLLLALHVMIGAVPRLLDGLVSRIHAKRVETLVAYREALAKDTARRRDALQKALLRLEREHQLSLEAADRAVRERRLELDRALAAEAVAELRPMIAAWYSDEPTRKLSYSIGEALAKYEKRAQKELGETLSGTFLARLFVDPLLAAAAPGARGLFAPTRKGLITNEPRWACEKLRDLGRPDGSALALALEGIETAMREAIRSAPQTCEAEEIAHCDAMLTVASSTSFLRFAETFDHAQRERVNNHHPTAHERNLREIEAREVGPLPVT